MAAIIVDSRCFVSVTTVLELYCRNGSYDIPSEALVST